MAEQADEPTVGKAWPSVTPVRAALVAAVLSALILALYLWQSRGDSDAMFQKF